MSLFPGADVVHLQKVIGIFLGLAPNIEDDAGSDGPRKRNLLGRPFPFGEMKRRIEMGSDMLGTAIIVRGIPKTSGRPPFSDLVEMERLSRRPVMCLCAERIGQINQLFFVQRNGR